MINQNDSIKIRYQSGVCSLEIFNVCLEDDGSYICRATNEHGTDYTECFISVENRDDESQSTTFTSSFRASSHRRFFRNILNSRDLGRSGSCLNVHNNNLQSLNRENLKSTGNIAQSVLNNNSNSNLFLNNTTLVTS